MAVSVDYVVRETASNLWRNRIMTIAAVLTVAVSLSLVGAALLLRQGVSNATVQWQHGVNAIVFFQPSATHNEQQAVVVQVRRLPFVRTCVYRSQLYDYHEAGKILPPEDFQS